MKKVDSGEYFTAPIENTFSEYKKYAAEQYLPVEIAKPPTEVVAVTESFEDKKQNDLNGENGSEPNLNDLTKRYNELNGGDGGSQSTAASPGSTSQAAATGGGSGSSTASAASSNAAATVGATSATAVVVAVVLLAVSLFPFIGKLISLLFGADYVAITLNVDSVIAGDNAFEGISASEFRLELVSDGQTKSITAQSGEQTYLFGGLVPNTNYTYNLVCDNPKFALNPVCYTDTVTTSSTGKPTAICDTTKTFVTLDSQTKTATLNFAAYVSDYFKEYDNYVLYVADVNLPKEFLFVSSDLDDNGYFNVFTENLVCQTAQVTIVGNKTSEPVLGDFADEDILLSHQIATNIPEDWFEEPIIKPPLTLDESSIKYDSTRESIAISGNLLTLNQTPTYTATVTQTDASGIVLDYDSHAELFIDAEKMMFFVSVPAQYGTKLVSFELIATDEAGSTTVFTSAAAAYDADQSFDASLNKVEPNATTLTYAHDGITVSVNTAFASENQNSFYKLTLTDGNGNKLDEYGGTKPDIKFVIAAENLPEKINFVYAEYATFAGTEVKYAEYICTAVDVDIPTATIDSECDFDTDYFTIDYTVSTDYDISEAQLILDIVYDGGTAQKITNVTGARGTIALDALIGEHENVRITPTLRFFDNQTDKAAHDLQFAEQTYRMTFDFAVTNVIADVSESTGTIPVKISFQVGRVPSTYRICVSVNQANTYLQTTDAEYKFDSLPIDADGTIKIYLVDADNNDAGHLSEYTISKTQANDALTEEPLFAQPNPGDAAVTYNDDGTINIYRNVWLEATVVTNPNILVNARLFGYSPDGSGNEQQFDCFADGDGEYAIAEDLPKLNYYQKFYYAVKHDGVTYTVKQYAYPSGSITPEPTVTASATETDDSTIVALNFTNTIAVLNKITINGVDYKFDTEDYGSSVTITLPKGTDVSQITVYVANFYYFQNLINFTNAGLQTKGNDYETVTIAVSI